MLSSNPQAQIIGGNVPNTNILVGGIFVPLSSIGKPGLSLIDLLPPSGQISGVDHVLVVNYKAKNIPQLIPVASIWAPPQP